ncbi:MAG: right-handed parallel beta-helix repeat-containing protein [Syntrophobacteraceae bacterium]
MFRWKEAVAVSLFWVVLTSAPVFAARYIVNSTISSIDWKAATWTTYPADPKATLGIVPCTPATAMQNARPGDIVYFRGGQNGSYNLAINPDYSIPALDPSNSGTFGNPIKFRNFPNEKPYLKNTTVYPNRGWHHPLIGSNGKNWITWEGFIFSAVSNAGKVIFTDASDCVMRNTEIAAVSMPSLSRGEGNYDGIRIERKNRLTVQNCLIHGVDDSRNERGAGIKLYSANNTIVEHSTFYGNDTAIFDKNNGQHNTFRLNFIRTGTSTPGSAILLGTHTGGPDTTDIKVYQNVIVTAPGSDGIESTETIRDLQVLNNVIYRNKGRGLNISGTRCEYC